MRTKSVWDVITAQIVISFNSAVCRERRYMENVIQIVMFVLIIVPFGIALWVACIAILIALYKEYFSKK